MNWNDSLQKLKGIGEKTAQAFHKLHIDTIGDLLRFYPRDYDLLEEITPVSALEGGKRSVVRAGVAGSISEKRVRSLTITTVYVSDATGRLLLTFFNLPYIRHELRPGTALYFRGTVSFRGKQAVMEQPVILTAKDYENLKGHLQPIYSLTAGIHQSIVRKAVRQVLENADFPETIPSKIREAYKLFSHNMAVSQIHFPDHMAALQEARKRLVFDEFLFFLLQVKELKNSGTDLTSSFPMLEVADTGRLLEALPFKLTDDQNKVWEEMKADLSGKSVMNRLIQGDVGSGKTILALLALLMTAAKCWPCSILNGSGV
jgi:ATP-dependent DNA helicase RecG